MRSSITCLASILDSLLSILSSNFLRLSTLPEEEVDVFVALAEEDDDDPIDDTVPVARPDPAMTLPAILGRSIEPVSLNPDPLLGFLSERRKTKKMSNHNNKSNSQKKKKKKKHISANKNWHTTKNGKEKYQ
jgi:hypothetical protein